MDFLWIFVLIISAAALLFIFVRKKQSLKWISYAIINLILGALILYVINVTSAFTHLAIPINLTTVLAVGILGVPGLMLLVSLKLVLF